MSDYNEHLISMVGGDGEADVLGEIEARAQAATEGPYVLARYDHGGGRMFAQTASGERGVLVADTFKVGDREFHAEARADVLALLAMVREQRAVIDLIANQANASESLCRMNGRDPELASVPAAAIRAALDAS